MLTRREKRTQKKVLNQRDEARTAADALKAETERLKGDVKALAGEEIQRLEREFASRTAALVGERDRATREREALLKDFEGALTAKLEETRAELMVTQATLASARNVSAEQAERIATLEGERDFASAHFVSASAAVEQLKKELSSLKMEDTKSLRKRLQTKSERIEALERENMQLKSAPKEKLVVSPVTLQNMLNQKLRRRLNPEVPVVQAAEPSAEVTPVSPTP